MMGVPVTDAHLSKEMRIGEIFIWGLTGKEDAPLYD